MTTQNEMKLREQLLTIARKNPCSLKKLAGDIGINEQILKRFLEQKKSSFKTMLHIEKFILEEKSKVN